MFRKNGYMFSFDLTSGHHHVETSQPHQTLLGFPWNFQGETRYYIFTVLPFGHSIAPLFLLRYPAPWFTISARQLASFIGKVTSTSPVTGNLPRISTRHCQMTVDIAEHWDTVMILYEYCKEEIVFWKNNIHLPNFRNYFVFYKPRKVTFSDASNIACGAVTYINAGEHVCHKMRTQDERSRSSTWKELSAIEFSLLSCMPILRTSHVKWYTDNQATVKIVEVGSMKLE